MGAIALLVLSKQSWPQDFWLNHSSVWIASSVVCGVCGLDALIALAIKGCCQAKRSSVDTSPENQPIMVSHATHWNDRFLQNTASMQDVHVPLCEALSNQGVNAQDYDLVLIRPVKRHLPGLFSADGAAPDFVLAEMQDKNPKNLRNYSPDRILIVTHHDSSETAGFEELVANHASLNSNPDIEAYLNGQYVHVHLNQYDLEQLQRNKELSPQAIQAIQKNN